MARPKCSVAEAAAFAREAFGLEGSVVELPSYADRNFRVGDWVLKIASGETTASELELQDAVMRRLHERLPGVAPVPRGELVELVMGGQTHWARVVSFVPGTLAEDADDVDPVALGELLGRVGAVLADMSHPGMRRVHRWDLQHADWTIGETNGLVGARRRLVERAQVQFAGHVLRVLDALPKSIIHGDANEQNVLVDGAGRATALIDFGDCCYTPRIFELAIAGAYAVFDAADPLAVLDALVRGYTAITPLDEAETAVLFAAVCMRLAVSVVMADRDEDADPANVSHPAEAALRRLLSVSAASDTERILAVRRRHLGPSLSVSYRAPLTIVRGRGSYLFDDTGRAYLDGVNNVCHVGHAHPRVVEAGARQMAELNTNTRYLHPSLARYAERLTALFPEPLEVCFLVSSGSEANELALRLARTFTGREAMMAVASGYHGNTSTLVDLSPYKHDGPGGAGPPPWLYTLPCPDPYRGFGGPSPRELFARAEPIAGVICEPLIGCGGQIVPPEGWLADVFGAARDHGAVCIADEVQIGFGRVGSHVWGFERDGVVPDIVTLGKPMGNGHPVAGVVTTRAIADAFHNGMEYFSTFGGNPVSCAIGMAVLDVIEDEGLREQAADVGTVLLDGFNALMDRHPCIGDVRGVGMYLGVELVKDRESKAPDAARLADVIERCREDGLLLSADGPHHNVLKMKPPLCFSRLDARLALAIVDRALSG